MERYLALSKRLWQCFFIRLSQSGFTAGVKLKSDQCKTWQTFLFVLTIILVFFNSAYSFALEIIVDTQTINIPAYKGFADVTNTKSDVVTDFQNLTPPMNNLKAVFVTTADAGALLKSKQLLLDRYCLVQTTKSLESTSLTVSMFTEFRQYLQKQIEKTLNESKVQFDKTAKDVSSNISKVLKQNVNMKIGEAIHVPFESESDNHIAFSLLSKSS
jgi:hypothetical protein